MPSLAMYKITPPTDSSEFENICMDYCRHKYIGDASLYGRKGQSQQGIDILITLKDNKYICAQCKNVKSVSVLDLSKWINKFDIECKILMKEFIILVSIENDAKLQEYICNISLKREEEGKVPIKLFFWNDIVHYIKMNQDMLRMYYPEFYQGQILKLEESTISPKEKYPERIIKEFDLKNLFLDETVKYQVEEFLNTNPRNGVPFKLVSYADVCIISVRKLLYRAPSLKNFSICYIEISEFIKLFDEYCEFLSNVTESNGNTIFATNKYNTKVEEDDLKYNDNLRQKALKKYYEILDD